MAAAIPQEEDWLAIHHAALHPLIHAGIAVNYITNIYIYNLY